MVASSDPVGPTFLPDGLPRFMAGTLTHDFRMANIGVLAPTLEALDPAISQGPTRRTPLRVRKPLLWLTVNPWI